jgi:arylsulfatase A-like enzyme
MNKILTAATLTASFFSGGQLTAAPTPQKPNVILILADDLGFGELGCYGNQKIHTPNLNRMAADGMRFTNFYAGAPVCAPSRSTLLTGQHTGHTRIRDNGELPLVPGDNLLASLFQSAGYRTAIIGKWGLGRPDSDGVPWKQNFDHFFGVLEHHHAHNYYPRFLYRMDGKVPLRNENDKTHFNNHPAPWGAEESRSKVDYAPDFFQCEALNWIQENRDRPFFLYYALTLPHANSQIPNGLEIPDQGIYRNEDWPENDRLRAAMSTWIDNQVGQIVDKLDELGLSDNTLILFTSDNGPSGEAGLGDGVERLGLAGGLRGRKSTLWEGGIRVPLLAKWPGQIKAGTTSDLPCTFYDIPDTMADLLGRTAMTKDRTDGESLWPVLSGTDGSPASDRPLIFYFYGKGGSRAIRIGDWKGHEEKLGEPLQLFNLSADPTESTNLAKAHPEIVTRMQETLDREFVPSPTFRLGP